MTDELNTKTDVEISEIFAVECAGWKFKGGRDLTESVWHDELGEFMDDEGFFLYPNFAYSVDDALRHIPFYWEARRDKNGHYVNLRDELGNILGEANSKTLARAACIAQIRAKRAEKKDSKS